MDTCLRLFLLPLLLSLLGCGKSYKLAPVSGQVMMDKQPLAGAEVRFDPVDEKLPGSIGITDDQGNYELHLGEEKGTRGAVLGEHKVTISLDLRRDKSKAKAMVQSRGRMPRLGEMVPAQYNRDSKLTCIVPPEGKKEANFDLKSK
jgi:hypothetical protein